ncbi:hypothetical protein CYQ60_14035, partial [Enterococcus faecium]
WLKTLYRKRAVTWPFIFYTIIWTLSKTFHLRNSKKLLMVFGNLVILFVKLSETKLSIYVTQKNF